MENVCCFKYCVNKCNGVGLRKQALYFRSSLLCHSYNVKLGLLSFPKFTLRYVRPLCISALLHTPPYSICAAPFYAIPKVLLLTPYNIVTFHLIKTLLTMLRNQSAIWIQHWSSQFWHFDRLFGE